MLRVAAFELTIEDLDLEQTPSTHVRSIEQAARADAQLVVFPDLTLPVSDATEHPLPAFGLDDAFLQQVSHAAAQHRVHVALGLPLRTGDGSTTSSALLYGPDGALLARADRQLADSAAPSQTAGVQRPEIVHTTLGPIALCLGSDTMSMERVRALSLAGAQLVCALFDQEHGAYAALHAAARAAENGLHVACAVARRRAPDAESQGGPFSYVFGPEGLSVASSSGQADGMALAELSLALSEPAGAPARRPELYRALLSRPRESVRRSEGWLELAVVTQVDAGSEEAAIESAAAFVRELSAQGVGLVALPALFCFPLGEPHDVEAAADWFMPAARRLADACAGSPTQVVTSLIERTPLGLQHVGVLIGHGGVVARAAQLHVPARLDSLVAGRRFELFPLPWGNLGLLVDADARLPEALRSLTLLGADLLMAVAARAALPVQASLMAAARENGLPVVLAAREETHGSSMVVDPAHPEQPACSRLGEAVLRAAVRLSADRKVLRPGAAEQCVAALVAR